MKKGDERNSDYGMHAEPDLVLSSYVRVIVHLGMFSLLQPESSTKRLNQSGHRSQLERNPGAPKRRGHGPLLLAPPARGQRRDPLQRRVPLSCLLEHPRGNENRSISQLVDLLERHVRSR